MNAPDAHESDRCFRCDYDLRGIADAQPCPECGLLAERSRRKTEHLADASPGWLRTVAVGLTIILLCVLVAPAWPMAFTFVDSQGYFPQLSGYFASVQTLLIGWSCVAVVFWLGVRFYTAREPRITSDATAWAGARLRRWAGLPLLGLLMMHVAQVVSWHAGQSGVLHYDMVGSPMGTFWSECSWLERIALLVAGLTWLGALSYALLRRYRVAGILTVCIVFALPLLVTVWWIDHVRFQEFYLQNRYWNYRRSFRSGIDITWYLVPYRFVARYGAMIAWGVLTIGCVPIPILLFFYLRWLARRAINARLAEHCAIMAVGASFMLLLAPIMVLAFFIAEQIWGEAWARRAPGSMLLIATAVSLAILFYFWSVLTLIRGAVAFARAARQRRREWAAADRSLVA